MRKLFRALFRREPPSLFARCMMIHIRQTTLSAQR